MSDRTLNIILISVFVIALIGIFVWSNKKDEATRKLIENNKRIALLKSQQVVTQQPVIVRRSESETVRGPVAPSVPKDFCIGCAVIKGITRN